MGLKGKTVLVTGSSRGIGKCIAKAFAESGSKVILNASRESEHFSKVLAEFKAAGYTCEGYACDVSDSTAVKDMFGFAKETFGSVEILVNNAGITKDNLLMRMTEEEWDNVIDVNLKGVFNCTKECIRPMIKKRWGRIISISSIIGTMGNAGQANYAASKAGIIGFSKSVAKEMGKKGVTCNVITPGFIESDMTTSLSDELKAKYLKEIPVNRFGKTEDIANAVIFLASEKASFITGQVINVDGGRGM